jgi:chaperone protein EcpD
MNKFHSESGLRLASFLAPALAMAAMAPAVHAGVQIDGTRVVYPGQERDVTVNLRNTGTGEDAARLVQVWVDDGDPETTAQTTTAPFVVTPPLSRIDGGQSQSIRLMYTGSAPLLQDRESVFYFNMLEVPRKPPAGESYLQLAVRMRMKVFYRPENLPGDPLQAADELEWRVVGQGDGYALECTNPGVYNVSINDARVQDDGRTVDENISGSMCPPKGRQVFPLRGPGKPAGTKVVFDVINDYGVPVVRERPLSP